MDYKDTIISQRKLPKTAAGFINILEAQKEQAEMCFKAGQKDMAEWLKTCNSTFRHYEQNSGENHYCPNCDNTIIGILPSELQAKLKEIET